MLEGFCLMPGTRKYPPDIRERAVRLVFEHEDEHPSHRKAICPRSPRSQTLNRKTLGQWVQQAERRSGRRARLVDLRATEDARPEREEPSQVSLSRCSGCGTSPKEPLDAERVLLFLLVLLIPTRCTCLWAGLILIGTIIAVQIPGSFVPVVEELQPGGHQEPGPQNSDPADPQDVPDRMSRRRGKDRLSETLVLAWAHPNSCRVASRG